MELYATNVGGICPAGKIKGDMLSPRGKEKFERLVSVNEKKAVQTAAADLLLSYIIKKKKSDLGSSSGSRPVYTGRSCPVDETENGKPFLKDGSFEFSVTHSGDVVLIACSDTKVGADIELLRPVKEGLPKAVLNGLELETYESMPEGGGRDRYFFRCLTEKESYVKYGGQGFKGLPKDIKRYEGVKFVTKYIFTQTGVYCLTLCAKDIKSLKMENVSFDDLIR